MYRHFWFYFCIFRTVKCRDGFGRQQLPAPYKRLIDGINQNLLRENDWTTDNLTNLKRRWGRLAKRPQRRRVRRNGRFRRLTKAI